MMDGNCTLCTERHCTPEIKSKYMAMRGKIDELASDPSIRGYSISIPPCEGYEWYVNDDGAYMKHVNGEMVPSKHIRRQ